METQKIPLERQYEITASYLNALDMHLADIVEGRTMEMLDIKDIAGLLHLHPTYLSNTVKETTGNSACYYFEDKILTLAKGMLEENTMSITGIAQLLTYDPSNFTKFFKKFVQCTPKQYREEFLKQQRLANS